MFSVRRSTEQARVALEREGVPSPNFLAPEIYDSWMRCIAHSGSTLDTRPNLKSSRWRFCAKSISVIRSCAV